MHPNHPQAEKPTRAIRVRSRRLDQVDEAKVALALSLMARRLIEERDAVVVPAQPDDAPPPAREAA